MYSMRSTYQTASVSRTFGESESSKRISDFNSSYLPWHFAPVREHLFDIV